MSVLRNAAVLGMIALIAAATGANAVPFTYVYTGVAFLDNDVSGSHPAGTNISGEFTIDVASNLNIAVADNTALVTSASFSDPLRSLSAPAPNPVFTFIFGTDANGDIVLPNAGNFVGFPVAPSPALGFLPVPGLIIEGPAGFSDDFIRVTSIGDFSQGPAFEEQAFSRAEGSFRLVVNEVPEPGSLALLGVGLVGFGFLRRRKR